MFHTRFGSAHIAQTKNVPRHSSDVWLLNLIMFSNGVLPQHPENTIFLESVQLSPIAKGRTGGQYTALAHLCENSK